MHGPVRVPTATGIGKATVTISFGSWFKGLVAPSIHKVEVAAPKTQLKLEPVSSRLRQRLIHPNKTSKLCSLRYFPDGKRIIAGDSPGGVIQVWDAQSGRQLTKIDTGYGRRGDADYLHLTPDWETIYVSHRGKTKHMRIEKDGKMLIRFEFEGDVRAWDLNTGELRERYQHMPPRGIIAMTLSPDGSTFLTSSHLPGEWAGSPKRTTSLWNARTKQNRSLGHGLGTYGGFSPDSRTVAIATHTDDGRYTTGIKLFDVETAREKLSISITEEYAFLGRPVFVPMGDILTGDLRVYAKRNDYTNWQSYLKFWDTTSGKEVGSIRADEKNAHFSSLVFSPDGQTMVSTTFYCAKNKLYLFDVPSRKLRAMTLLGEGEKMFVRPPIFSPDGKWIAVITQVFPEDTPLPAAEDVPQPRIHLIDAATGEMRETLVAPQGFPASACFSPDGKTLATGGRGRVLLWDFRTPPGTE